MKVFKKEGEKNWRLQATFDGKQRQPSMGTPVERDAISKANRFMATAAANGYVAACRELRGKQVVKRGDPLTYERMCELFREFLEHEDTPPRETTVTAYLYNLKRTMDACGAKTIQQIDQKAVRAKLRAKNPTPAQVRSFASIVRNAKSVFAKRPLQYYKERGFELVNPFEGMQVRGPKVEPYTPLPEEVREAVWNTAARGEMILEGDYRTTAGKKKLGKTEPERLGAQAAMIVLLGMGAGMRRSEIEACRVRWFSVQRDNVILSIKETAKSKGASAFTTKNTNKRDVPITKELHGMLLQLRERAIEQSSPCEETRELLRNDPHMVPVLRRKGEGARLWGRFKQVNNWLKQMGVPSTKKLHDMRKEFGSHITAVAGIFEAAKALGNSALVAETHYAGMTRVKTIDMDGAINKRDDEAASLKRQNEELQAELKKQGEEFRAILSKLAAR